MLSAFAAAHAAGILHRDIKPANILFTASGEVKVADFGIAKSAGTPATMTGQIVGTMAYLSADRVAGRPATVADDLYAVGAVGYEALSGRKPFPQENLAALARAIAEDTPPPLALLRPDVEPGLARRSNARWRAIRSGAFRAPRRCAPRCRVRRNRFGPAADRGAGRAAAAADDHGCRRAGRAQPDPQTARSRGRARSRSPLQPFWSFSSPPRRRSAPEPAGTSTSSPPTTPSLLPPPPPPPPPPQPAPIDQGPPGKKKGHGNGGKKGD